MPRLDSKIKARIIKMIHDGKSLNEIQNLTGKRKTTIYYYIRNIRGKKHKPIKLKINNLELIGEIIGLFAGDGQYVNIPERWDYRIKIFFNKNEEVLVDYYKKSFFRLTNKFPTIFSSGSVSILQITSKEFCDFILKWIRFGSPKIKTVEIRDKALLKNKDFTLGLLRGLIDSDGYVRKGRKEIYYGSISKNLFKDFLFGLDSFGFEYKTYLQKRVNCSDFYKVRLTGDEVDRFIEVIKPVKGISARTKI